MSINISDIGRYGKYPYNVSPMSLDDGSLSDGELYLAKGHLSIMKASNMMGRMLDGEQGEDFEAQLREAMDGMRKYPDFFKLTGQVFDCSELVDVTSLPTFNLPKQGYSVNRSSNTVTIGVGSVINIDSYSFYIGDNRVELRLGGSSKTSANYNDSNNNFAHALRELLWATKSGNVNFGDNRDLNDSMLILLGKMGVDTGKDFSINNTVFEVKNGILQTKEYTISNSNKPFNTYAYLNALLFKAYEQNLLPADYMTSFESIISKYV